MPNIEWIPSPNHWNGRPNRHTNNARVRIICIHHTAGGFDSVVNHFKDPASQVSSHYLVSSDGNRVVQFVQEKDAAWSCEDGNAQTINIECEDYPEQGVVFNGYATVAELVREIAARNNIVIGNYTVLPHYVYVDTQCPAGVDVNRIMQMATGVPTNAPVVPSVPQATQTSVLDQMLTPPRHGAHVTVPALLVRPTADTRENPIRTMYKGDGFWYTEIVTGENVQGNNKWFALEDGHYAWAGGATVDNLTA